MTFPNTSFWISLIFGAIFVSASLPDNCIPDASYSDGLCGKYFVAEQDLAYGAPRGLFVTPDGDILGLERRKSEGSGVVVRYIDEDDDGTAESSYIIATAPRLNHGLTFLDGYMYASSDTTVYRWPYNSSVTSNVDDEREVIIFNINADGRGGAPVGHRTRTLAFDLQKRLYVSVGSYDNVDINSDRSRIRRFVLENIPSGGFDFLDGYVFADGLRNEVGLAFDKYDVLWGVENSADELVRDDLGGDIHEDNPSEELNRISSENEGQQWGYPYCWTEFNLPSDVGGGRGTVWSWPSFMDDGVHDDNWCRNNTIPPTMALQGHSSPLGISFFEYKSDLPANCEGGLTEEYDGDAFIGYHGSWNRDVATGYKVVRVPMKDGMPSSEQPIDVMWHKGEGAKWPNGLRPVDVKFDKCNRLLISSDGTGRDEVIGEMIITLYHTEQCCVDTDIVQTSQDEVDTEVTQDENIYNHMIDDADDGSDDGADDTGKGLDDYGDGADGADDGVVLPTDDEENSGAFVNKALYLVVAVGFVALFI